jgi:hypothetical protein
MAKITRDSRFGLNGIGLHELSHRQGDGWNRFENLKWPFVSPSPGVYRFDGSVHPNVKFDELFRADRDHGIFIVPYLSMTPSYLVPKGVTKDGYGYPPTDFSKFGEFAFQAVARYGSKKHPPEVLLTNDKLSGLGHRGNGQARCASGALHGHRCLRRRGDDGRPAGIGTERIPAVHQRLRRSGRRQAL